MIWFMRLYRRWTREPYAYVDRMDDESVQAWLAYDEQVQALVAGARQAMKGGGYE